MDAKSTSRRQSCPESYVVARQWLDGMFEQVQFRLDGLERKVEELTPTPKAAVDHEWREELVRCLIALGQARGFNTAIEAAIEDYVSIRRELRELEKLKISKTVRPQIEMCFSELLTRFCLALSRVGVSIHEIAPGTPLDKGLHEVIEHLVTDDESHLDTIWECIQPEFRWSTGQVDRVQRARVIAFTKFDSHSENPRFGDSESENPDPVTTRQPR